MGEVGRVRWKDDGEGEEDDGEPKVKMLRCEGSTRDERHAHVTDNAVRLQSMFMCGRRPRDSVGSARMQSMSWTQQPLTSLFTGCTSADTIWLHRG